MSARNAWLKIKTCLHARKTERERERESEREGEERGRERGAGPGRESKKEKRHGSMCCSGPASCGEGPVSTAKKKRRKGTRADPKRRRRKKKEREGEKERRNRNPKTAKQRTPAIICKYPYKKAPPRPNKNTSNKSSGARVPKPFGKHAVTKIELRKTKLRQGELFFATFGDPNNGFSG